MSDANDFKQRGQGDGQGVISLDRPRPTVEPPPEPEQPDDAGTQALSDALRSSFVIVKVITVILVIVFFGSGIFTVPSQERAIKLRFGKPVGTGNEMLLEPGLHFGWPYPIDEVVRIPTSQQTVRSTAGWYAITPEQEAAKDEPYAGPSLNPAVDGYTITSDANIIHVRATLSYRITEPLKYALEHANASNVVQSALNNAIVQASARTRVDDALRLDRAGFQEKVLNRVRELVRDHDLGITIDLGTVEVIAPRYLKDKFEEVTSAEAARQQALQDARRDASKIQSAAESEAAGVVNTAQAESARMLGSVKADAQNFLGQLEHYARNPALFESRWRTEALRRAMTNVQDIMLLDRKNDQLWLQLNRDPDAPRPQAPNP